MTLYDYLSSGNGYKIRLLASYKYLSYKWVNLDIHKGETQTPEFLALNPAGQIPLLQLDDGRLLAESNAILHYLAQGTAYFPDDPYEQSKCLQWMFWEQYRHEPSIAVARFIRMYKLKERADELPALMQKGRNALSVMDGQLAGRDYFTGGSRSIADIALYAYTHVAGEGGFDLSDYPNVSAWLARMADHPNHILITDKPS